MPEIYFFVGREWHSSWGAVAALFVVRDGVEIPFYKAGVGRILDKNVHEVQGGKHGAWFEESWEVPEGLMLKFFAASTRKGRVVEGGAAYCIVDSSVPRIRIVGPGYGGNDGTLRGPLRIIPTQEYDSYGIRVEPKYFHYYARPVLKVTQVQDKDKEEGEKAQDSNESTAKGTGELKRRFIL